MFCLWNQNSNIEKYKTKLKANYHTQTRKHLRPLANLQSWSQFALVFYKAQPERFTISPIHSPLPNPIGVVTTSLISYNISPSEPFDISARTIYISPAN